MHVTIQAWKVENLILIDVGGPLFLSLVSYISFTDFLKQKCVHIFRWVFITIISIIIIIIIIKACIIIIIIKAFIIVIIPLIIIIIVSIVIIMIRVN